MVRKNQRKLSIRNILKWMKQIRNGSNQSQTGGRMYRPGEQCIWQLSNAFLRFFHYYKIVKTLQMHCSPCQYSLPLIANYHRFTRIKWYFNNLPYSLYNLKTLINQSINQSCSLRFALIRSTRMAPYLFWNEQIWVAK